MPEPNLPPLKLQDSTLDNSNSIKKSLDIAYLHKNIPDQAANYRDILISRYKMSPDEAYEFAVRIEINLHLINKIINIRYSSLEKFIISF